MARPRGVNVVSAAVFIFLIVAGYLSYLYVPILWTQNELSALIKEESFGAKRKSPEQVQQSLKASAEDRLRVKLELEDIQVDKYADRVRVRVTWRPVVEFIKGRSVRHAFTFDEETVFY